MQLKRIIELINKSELSDRRKEYAIYKLRMIVMNPRWRKTFAYNKHKYLPGLKFIWCGVNNNISLVNTPIKETVQFMYWSKIFRAVLNAQMEESRTRLYPLHKKIKWDKFGNPFIVTCDIGPDGIVIPHSND